jgi:hypothetical protein
MNTPRIVAVLFVAALAAACAQKDKPTDTAASATESASATDAATMSAEPTTTATVTATAAAEVKVPDEATKPAAAVETEDTRVAPSVAVDPKSDNQPSWVTTAPSLVTAVAEGGEVTPVFQLVVHVPPRPNPPVLKRIAGVAARKVLHDAYGEAFDGLARDWANQVNMMHYSGLGESWLNDDAVPAIAEVAEGFASTQQWVCEGAQNKALNGELFMLMEADAARIVRVWRDRVMEVGWNAFVQSDVEPMEETRAILEETLDGILNGWSQQAIGADIAGPELGLPPVPAGNPNAITGDPSEPAWVSQTPGLYLWDGETVFFVLGYADGRMGRSAQRMAQNRAVTMVQELVRRRFRDIALEYVSVLQENFDPDLGKHADEFDALMDITPGEYIAGAEVTDSWTCENASHEADMYAGAVFVRVKVPASGVIDPYVDALKQKARELVEANAGGLREGVDIETMLEACEATLDEGFAQYLAEAQG